ncbi:MAG TPA: penicillin-binding protein activator [Spongiibacteraceae bacterium]
MKIDYAHAHHNLCRTIGALLTLALLGCSSTPSVPPTHAEAANNNVQQLLDKAHASAIDARAPYLFDAAALALQTKQTQTAEQILREIDTLKLTTLQRARSKLFIARLALQQNKPEQALNALQDRQLLQLLDQLTATEQTDVSSLRAQALYATGKYFASAQERVFVEPLLSDAQLQSNHDEIRRALTNLSAAELQRYRDKTNNEPMRGWLDLAIAAKENRGNIQMTTTTATNQTLPADVIAFNGVAAEQPKQIALLLPLSGKLAGFGEAVRDGFFAAWYEAQRQGEQLSDVRVYDSDSAGIVQLYQQAVDEGANVVIGPLEKLQVAQFYTQTLPVPLLALNRADNAQAPPTNLYQFSLAPEDETAQLAELIAKDNRRNVLVIASEDEAHSRETQAFQQRWQSLGGNIAGTALYRDQQSLSTAIRGALNIPRSEARGKEIENILNRNIEFTPHRRRDIDSVFMLAKPAQARSIKPLLNFYYAGDLAVYSTSRIYNGYGGGALDRDLEKVRFTEMPWVLQQSSLKQQILTAQPNAKIYLRLYAMGIDSFNLYPRLHQLEALNGKRVAGQTGTLALDAQHIVQRELLLAEMRNGAAVPYGNPMNNTDDNSRRDENNSARESAGVWQEQIQN